MADLIHLHCHQNNMIGNYSNNSSVDNSRHSDPVVKGAVGCTSQPASHPHDELTETAQKHGSPQVSITTNITQQQQQQCRITAMETIDASKSSSSVINHRNSMRDYYSNSPILFSSSNMHTSRYNQCTNNIHCGNTSHNVVQQIIDNDGRPLSFASSSITTPTYYSEDRIINNNNRNALSQTNIDGLSSDTNDSNYIYHSLNKKMSECQMNDYYQINFSNYNTNNTESATTLSKTSNVVNTTKHAHPHDQQPIDNLELNQEPMSNQRLSQHQHQVNTNNPFYCAGCHGNGIEQQAQQCQCFEENGVEIQQTFESQVQTKVCVSSAIQVNDCPSPIPITQQSNCNQIQSNPASNILSGNQNESPCSLRTAGAGDDGYFSTSTNRTVTTLMMTASNDSSSIMTKQPGGMPNNTASITSTPIIYDENKVCDAESENESQLCIVLLDKKQRYLMLSYHVQKSKCRSVRKIDVTEDKESTVQLSMDLETSLWSRDIRRRQHQQRDMNSIIPQPSNPSQSGKPDNSSKKNQEKPSSKFLNSHSNTDIHGNNSDVHINNTSNTHQQHNNISCCSCIMSTSNDTTSSQNSYNNNNNNNNNTSQISTNSFSSNSALMTSVNSYSNVSSCWQDEQILVFSDTELYGTRFHIDSDLEGDEEDLVRLSGRKYVARQNKSEIKTNSTNVKLFTPKVTATHIPVPVSSSPQLRAHTNKSATQEVRARSSLPPLIENKQISNSGSEKRKVEIRSQRRHQHQSKPHKTHSTNSKLMPPKIRPRSVPANSDSLGNKQTRPTSTQTSSDFHKPPPTQHKSIKSSSNNTPTTTTTTKPPHPSSSSSSSSTNLSSPSSSKSKPTQSNSRFPRYYNQSTIPPPIPPRSTTNTNRRSHRQQQPSPLVTGSSINQVSKIPTPQDYVNTASTSAGSTSNSPSLLTHNYHEDEEMDDIIMYDRDLLIQLENYQLPNSCLNTVVLQHFK